MKNIPIMAHSRSKTGEIIEGLLVFAMTVGAAFGIGSMLPVGFNPSAETPNKEWPRPLEEPAAAPATLVSEVAEVAVGENVKSPEAGKAKPEARKVKAKKRGKLVRKGGLKGKRTRLASRSHWKG